MNDDQESQYFRNNLIRLHEMVEKTHGREATNGTFVTKTFRHLSYRLQKIVTNVETSKNYVQCCTFILGKTCGPNIKPQVR